MAAQAELNTCFDEPKVLRRLLSVAITCPKCRETNIRRSHRRLLDFLLRSFGLVPFRCNICEHRFFRFRKSYGS
jgi:hypothetical protein